MSWLRLVTLLISGFMCREASGADLGLFLPIIYETKQLQEALQSDPVLGKYEIRIFQKFEDLLIASSSKKFDIAILPASYEKFYQDYKVVLRFTSATPKQKNMIVSFKKTLPADFSVAVIDEVGRKNIRKWLKQVCSKCTKQKDVKKAKDLYPMLALGSTDSILINSLNFNRIKEESGADLFVVFAGEDEDLPGIYVPIDKQAPDLNGISKKTFSAIQLSVGEAAK